MSWTFLLFFSSCSLLFISQKWVKYLTSNYCSLAHISPSSIYSFYKVTKPLSSVVSYSYIYLLNGLILPLCSLVNIYSPAFNKAICNSFESAVLLDLLASFYYLNPSLIVPFKSPSAINWANLISSTPSDLDLLFMLYECTTRTNLLLTSPLYAILSKDPD